jgi:hypothetical protein
MSNKIEFIEKEADSALADPSILEDMLISYEEPGGSDLVVFEEDLDDEGLDNKGLGDDALEFLEDLEGMGGEDSDEEALDEEGPAEEGLEGTDDLEPLDMKEFAGEWSENIKELVDDVEKGSIGYVGQLSKKLEEEGLELAVSEDGEDFGVIPIPGSLESFNDESENDVVDSNWSDDRDSSKFMSYMHDAYPTGIPQHDGSSMIGCEMALLYLNKLNKEISEALRSDPDGSLDPLVLEDYRVKILKDMVLLKERMNNLKRDLGDATRNLTRASDDSSIEKLATTPRVQIVATPFERAISGILINSVVSAGHPFEDVYDYLKTKYSFSERDELSIMQLVMDSGHYIFKDRGAIGSGFDEDGQGPGGNIASHGIDFIKNYFA